MFRKLDETLNTVRIKIQDDRFQSYNRAIDNGQWEKLNIATKQIFLRYPMQILTNRCASMKLCALPIC